MQIKESEMIVKILTPFLFIIKNKQYTNLNTILKTVYLTHDLDHLL